ncbi:MAG: hypothetical protein E7190_05180 [Erysipelotrichaceae bacterium]|nr:hypothetical protein [Erysipelotrichaceae bacterium]
MSKKRKKNQKNNPLRRNFNDILFRAMFSRKRNVIRLYHDLHPEDTDPLSETDIEIMTLTGRYVSGEYNDLSFSVRGTLMILTEAQSIWSENIGFRLIGYLYKTLNTYVRKTGQNRYNSMPLQFPVCELAVIYSGTDQIDGKEKYLNYRIENLPVSMNIKVITPENSTGIIKVYIRQCQIMRQLRKMYGDNPQAIVDDFFTICENEGISEEYLEEFREEMKRNMRAWMTQAEAFDEYDASMKKQIADAKAEATEKAALLALKDEENARLREEIRRLKKNQKQ